MIWRRITGSDADVVKTLNELRNSAHLRLAADEAIRLREAARTDSLRLLNVSGVSKGDNSVPGADGREGGGSDRAGEASRVERR